ncbi:MAG: hypothetical protein WKF34_07090 [Pyrinomonadaceae bacterium]
MAFTKFSIPATRNEAFANSLVAGAQVGLASYIPRPTLTQREEINIARVNLVVNGAVVVLPMLGAMFSNILTEVGDLLAPTQKKNPTVTGESVLPAFTVHIHPPPPLWH